MIAGGAAFYCRKLSARRFSVDSQSRLAWKLFTSRHTNTVFCLQMKKGEPTEKTRPDRLHGG